MRALSSNTHVAVQLRGITKRFPGVLANDAVDLSVRRGEIHALLGENGAGKSTLMSVLCGLYQPDAGTIEIADEEGLRPVRIRSPRAAIDLGIGMVHQHFKLVRTQTVAENVILGLDRVPFRLRMERIEREIADLGLRYGMPVDPSAYIWQLSVGEQQRVEILKALYRQARVLVLDEPTAVLTPQEAFDLGAILRTMTESGKTVIFISHKLDEVMAFADRVTVLRKGRNVATLDVAETDKNELARLMVGRDLDTPHRKETSRRGPVVLKMQGVSTLNDRGLPALHQIDLEVRGGEILGVAGVAGNGQQELAEVATGLRRVTSGRIEVHGSDVTNRRPRKFIESGVCHVPADRLGIGLAGNLSLADNLAMKFYRHPPMALGPFLRKKPMTAHATRLISAFNVSVPNPDTPARLLSGGNQQKAILAREITAGERTTRGKTAPLLVAAYPTRGLDVGAIEAVRSRLLDQRNAGTAILLISEDLDELLTLADRIAVLHGGRLMGVVDPRSTSREELGLLMAGEGSR